MATNNRRTRVHNRDPLTKERGAHPVGTAVGAAAGGAAGGAGLGAAGAALGGALGGAAVGGPIGAAVGTVAGVVGGAVGGGLLGKGIAENRKPTAKSRRTNSKTHPNRRNGGKRSVTHHKERSMATISRSTTRSRRRKAAARELINTGTDKRYVRRSKSGQFRESDDVGRSLAADRKRKAKTTAKRGHGDKGDRSR